MEQRLGHDFSRVRVHTDAKAAESARVVKALAYTMGCDVAFGTGQYAPHTAAGRGLLAHELTHVTQQRWGSKLASERQNALLERTADNAGPQSGVAAPIGVARSGMFGFLQRQEYPPNSLPQSRMEIPGPDAARLQQLRDLLAQITQETERSMDLRARWETLPPASSADRERVDTELNGSRTRLVNLLQRRIVLLGDEIRSLQVRIGPNPVCRPGGPPELESLGHDLSQREQELNEHRQQLRPLQLWRTRRRLEAVQRDIEQTNRDILALPPVNPEAPTSDMNDPRARELMRRRAVLEQRQRTLASSMTSLALRYRQSDPRWGSQRYGTSPKCTSVGAAGCGPTSLAILLNYLFQEDPELVGGGDLEFVQPPETADYAATHGRVCNSGTAGDTMVTNVHTQWPGFHGRRISLGEATTVLLSGDLVIFLCRSCSGQKAGGGRHTYGGHYMVLNGVNPEGTAFGVLDPAGANIVTISRTELQNHTSGFWTVQRK